MTKAILEIKNLKKHFPVGNNILKAVDDISLTIHPGETLGLVGESGCGKSTVGRTILKLHNPTSGQIFFEGQDVFGLSSKETKQLRRQVQMIFQDPYASLNPRMTIQDIIGEALDIHKIASGKQRINTVEHLLETVGLKKQHASRFPHEFSGGQRQRIGIARALAVKPKFIVCDEPLSALDMSIQAQIVNLLKSLQEQMGLTYLFISHDLSMVEHIADHVAVMYLGKVVEVASCKDLYLKPSHPYTQALLSAIPVPDPKEDQRRKRIVLQGDVPSPINPPKGCVFCSRCPQALPQCKDKPPPCTEIKKNHFTSCHLY
jgi:oligopeptide/dipeptide ABC transporter ATP-binding protein